LVVSDIPPCLIGRAFHDWVWNGPREAFCTYCDVRWGWITGEWGILPTKAQVRERRNPEDRSDAPADPEVVSDTQGCHNPRHAEAYGGKATEDLPQLGATDLRRQLLRDFYALAVAVLNDPLHIRAQLQEQLTLAQAASLMSVLHVKPSASEETPPSGRE